MKHRSVQLMNEYGAKGIPFLFIIDFDAKNPIILRKEEWKEDHIWFQFENASYEAKGIYIPDQFEFHKFPIPFAEYLQAFDYVVNEIGKGNSYLVNLTFSTPIQTNLNFRQLYVLSEAKYKLWFRDRFVCFSPETFVKIQDGLLSTYPMKGTINAELPDAKNRILADKKEFSEHVTVVDLLRNDLSILAEKVRVKRFRYIETLRTSEKSLLQVSSHIQGQLPQDYPARIGEILFGMLPAGSISGAPKPKTMEIIRQAETHQRGYYTGVMGYFDGKNLDSGVMIRFIEEGPKGLVYKSGGGITYQSHAETEYQELIDKIYVPLSRKHLRPQSGVSTSFLAQ